MPATHAQETCTRNFASRLVQPYNKELARVYISQSCTSFLADRSNGRAYATVLRPSFVVVCNVMWLNGAS